MVHAYILIQTEVGKAASVASEVREIKGVTEAEDVTGPKEILTEMGLSLGTKVEAASSPHIGSPKSE